MANKTTTKRTIVKMSVNLSSEVVGVLRKLAAKRRTTMTDVLRQAVGTEKFIDEVADRQGTILIEDKNGRVRQLVFR